MTMLAARALRIAHDDSYRRAMTSDQTCDLLFVYGTLMRGFDHPMARLLSANATFVGEASCRGRLYLVKHYPGLLLSDDAADIVQDKVYGELFALREPEAMLREFDMYEACGEGFAEPTEYVRRMLAVTLADGSTRDAWTYIYNWPVDGLPLIESGRFLAH
jgi:gamma-glutamylcyclotransferase (GGCT)/AIG2-like uncharacterized protein YtfP